MTEDEIISRFGWPDYVVFGAMLSVSALIGVYFARKNENSTQVILLAGKSMTTFPVAMSLIASFMSAITLLGTPSEVYQFGCVYWLIGFSYILVMPSAAYLYLPVFCKLEVTSAYEYLERRFHVSCRMLGSGIFIIQMCLYMAIVVYAPALALSQVTGLNKYLSCTLICFVCIFYTTLGGMKAVLWTDALQVVIMYVSIVFVIIKGCLDIGGFEHVWNVNLAGDRVELVNWDPNPGERHTIWTLIIGGYFTWITIYGCNQAQVQRYLCVKKQYMAVRALWINLIGLSSLMLICSFGGMVVYAKYAGCDPVKSGIVDDGNQLFPLFVMDTLGQWPGLPGLFVAGIFSGALSTVSSGMNSLAAITLEDFLKRACFPNMSERAAALSSKFLSLFYGILTFGLVFVAEKFGDVLSAALSIFGMVGGPLLGLFTLGMFFPWANKVGAFIGTIVAFVITFWIGVGHQVAKFQKKLVLPVKPTSVEECYKFNITVPEEEAFVPPEGDFPSIYWLSYMWYSALACFIVIIVGMIISLITGIEDVRKLNPDMISPGVRVLKNYIPTLKDLGVDYVSPQEGHLNYGFREGIANGDGKGAKLNKGFIPNNEIEMHTESSKL